MTSAAAVDTLNFRRRVLFITQTLPVPCDSRVWQQAKSLSQNGYVVAVICPKGKTSEPGHEKMEDISIFRYMSPGVPQTSFSYVMVCCTTLMWQFMLACRVFFTLGLDVVQICNPPDSAFAVGAFFKIFFNRHFVLDSRIGAPELCAAQMHISTSFKKFLLRLERWAYKLVDIAIVANESIRTIALERGQMPPHKVVLIPTAAYPLALPKAQKTAKLLVHGASSINPETGISYFAEAVRQLTQRKKYREVRFVFSQGTLKPEKLNRPLAQLGVAERSNIHRRCYRGAIYRNIRRAEYFRALRRGQCRHHAIFPALGDGLHGSRGPGCSV